jgi:hypothetical protein
MNPSKTPMPGTARSWGQTSTADPLALVLLRVRLRARRRLAWVQTGYKTVNGSADMRMVEIDALLNDRDDPAQEAAWIEQQTELNEELEAVEAVLAADHESRLAALRQVFALRDVDEDILHVCLAQAVDPSLGRLFAYLQGDGTRAVATPSLIARVCGHGRFLLWESDSPLRRWQIVREDEGGLDQYTPLTLDPTIRDWLAGLNPLDPLLVGQARLCAPLAPLREWDVAGAVSFTAQSLEHDPTTTVILHVIAPPNSGRKTFAAGVSAQLGMPLLTIDTGAISDEDWETTFIHAQRHAFLSRCALAWYGGRLARSWSGKVAHFPVQFIVRDAGEPYAEIADSVDWMIDLPVPGIQTRLDLWRHYAPETAALQPEALADLALRRSARVGDIAEATRIPGASAARMAESLRRAQRDMLGDLAEALECPFGWDDLIIGAGLRATLEDFVYEARDRATFWEHAEARRLFPQGRGLAALFSGAPGTGKTMAAQVIGAELGLDLFRIDLSTVVSKYVGETASNLQRILTRAARMDVILFFDEADALFARRTDVKDAHDRFANTDTNHLLQALENYGGIAVLATNRKGNIDPAFIRRLRYVLDFPKPDANQRWEMWTRMVTALAGNESQARLRPLLERLALELEMTGAQIKYAVLTAVFAARRDGTALGAEHLLRGLDRELLKEGRSLSDRERSRLEEVI